jgi:hypothetical protein
MGHPCATKGIPKTKEQKDAQSKAMKGRPSPKRGMKIGKIKPWSEEAKKKHSMVMQGKTSLRGVKKKNKKGITSDYVGVCWDKSRNKWIASINVRYKSIHLGRFKIEEEAARAYNEAALKYFGESANLNIIEKKNKE